MRACFPIQTAMPTDSHDAIYANPLKEVGDFSFDEQVTRVFPDMIKRSVPGYEIILSHIGSLAQTFARPGGRCYDLGCSLGAATLSLRHRIPEDNTIIAVDNSAPMIARCQTVIERDTAKPQVELRCEDIQDVEIAQADVVLLNFTLQFIPVESRLALLEKICQGLRAGGLLLLSEKIAFESPDIQATMTEKHHQYKRDKGYSALEVSQKRAALERVLIPESRSTHLTRLKAVGFSSVDTWFQYFNFAAFMAIK